MRNSLHRKVGRGRTLRNGSRLEQGALVLLALSIVLSPNFAFRKGLYRPRAEDFLLLALSVFWFLPRLRAIRRPSSRSFRRITRVLAGMAYVGVISIGAGVVAFQQPLLFRDFMIVPMIVRYWLIFLVSYTMTQRPGGRRVLVWAIVVAIAASAGVGVMQHFNLAGVNDWLTPSFVTPSNVVVGLEMVRRGLPGGRVVGTHGDPRHFAYMMVVGIALCTAILFQTPEGFQRKVVLGVLALSLMAIAFSASRTGVLSLMVVLAGAFTLQMKGRRGASRALSVAVALGLVAALVLPTMETQTFERRVMTFGTSSYHTSLNARIRDLRIPFEEALEHPIIWLTGRGPSKAVVRTDSHNDFGWYFYRFGLPGLALYLFLLVFLMKSTRVCWENAADQWAGVLSMAGYLVTLNWTLFAMAENIFKDPQLMALNMLVVGAAVGCRSQRFAGLMEPPPGVGPRPVIASVLAGEGGKGAS